MPTNDEIINKMPTVIRGSISDIEKALYEARASTAKEIFAALKKHDTGYGDIVLSKEDFQALKKQYKVD